MFKHALSHRDRLAAGSGLGALAVAGTPVLHRAMEGLRVQPVHGYACICHTCKPGK